jgi:hypothetical protein
VARDLSEVSHDEDAVTQSLLRLVDAWCDRRDLHALARVLPAYTSNLGATDRRDDLLRALRTLRADRHLPEDEQRILERIVVEVERIVRRR